jgi:hypothetical protein
LCNAWSIYSCPFNDLFNHDLCTLLIGVSFIPNTKGRGCFKCGEMGHVARECTNDGKNGEAIQEKPKYELKDRSGQHGGTGKKYISSHSHLLSSLR